MNTLKSNVKTSFKTLWKTFFPPKSYDQIKAEQHTCNIVRELDSGNASASRLQYELNKLREHTSDVLMYLKQEEYDEVFFVIKRELCQKQVPEVRYTDGKESISEIQSKIQYLSECG